MRLKVRMRNENYDRRHLYAYPIAEYTDYVGEIVPKPKWVDEDSFCLSTGDLQFPFRVLSKENIICGWEIKSKQSDSRIYKIKNYLVTEKQNQWSCSCVGYGYRRRCSHIEMATAEAKTAA